MEQRIVFDYDLDMYVVRDFEVYTQDHYNILLEDCLTDYHVIDIPEVVQIMKEIPRQLTDQLGEIVIFNDFTKKALGSYTYANPFAVYLAVDALNYQEHVIKRVLIHELAHLLYAHDGIWLDLIWESHAVERSVTEYAQQCHANEPNGFNGTEEFAEVVMSYFNHPESFKEAFPCKARIVEEHILRSPYKGRVEGDQIILEPKGL